MTYHNTTQSTTNAQGDIAPAGYHYMPDGSLMLDIEHTIKKIFSFTIDDTDLAGARSSRNLTITGDVGARFTLFISNEDIFKFYNFTTDAFYDVETRLHGEIPNHGVYKKKINFPSVTDDDQYDFQLMANKHHNTELGFGENKVYYKTSILQKIDKSIKAQITTDTTGDFQSFASIVTLASGAEPASKNAPIDSVFSETVKAIDAATGGTLKIIRQPIPSDFKFSVVRESIGEAEGDVASSNPTVLYLDSVDNLAIGMALDRIESSSTVGSPVITKINKISKIVTLSLAQTWDTAKDITFKGSCGTTQLNSAYGANITITDMIVALIPFSLTTTIARNSDTDIVCTSVFGVKVGSTYTGIGVDNAIEQFVTAIAYGSDSFTTTTGQTFPAATRLDFQGCAQEAQFAARFKVTKMPKENLIIQLQIDNILSD